MALAYSITLETDLPDAMPAYRKAGVGKALAREADKLDSTARRKGVASLSSMLSESASALAEQLRADGFDPTKMRLPPEQWYDPAEGLKSVRALWEYVTANLNDFKQPNPILRDLKSAEALLTAAAAAGTKFHFVKADV